MATKAAAKKTSTAVAVKSNGAVVSIQERIRALAERNKDKVAPAGGNGIRVTQDKKFVVPGQGEIEEMDLVIVDFCSTQDYYPNGFDPKNIVPPDCFAIGDNPQKLVPSPNSPNLQVDLKKGQGCNECKMFQWGSDPKGDGKACKSGRKLAVVQPDDVKDSPMLVVKASPTAIKGFDGFIAGLNRIGSIPVAVVTHLDFNPAVKHAQIRFTNPLPNENVEVHLARMEEAEVVLKNEPDVTGWSDKKKAAAPRRGR